MSIPLWVLPILWVAVMLVLAAIESAYHRRRRDRQIERNHLRNSSRLR